MKKCTSFLLIFLFSVSIYILEGCGSKDNPEPGGSWTEEEKRSHDRAISLQDEIYNDLTGWFQTMDSIDAIQKAYEAFSNNESVNTATINSQGIAVQYANGMRGGLYLNPLDGKDEVGETFNYDPATESDNSLKSLVNKRKMILINPHYWERSYYTDQILSIDNNNLGKVGMEISTFYKNEEATVDRFTELSGYGIIQLYSHGWAWPKKENITEIYLLTGETANETTSKKYWNEIKTGTIPLLKIIGRNNHYLLSPEFITEHNDFSNDTILFFGGFCYSFLGGWPDIIDDFGDGAYTGYDWSVYTHKNANWTVNAIYHLSDTAAEQPITLNEWFNRTDVPKSYWNARDNREVKIHYTGDGNLTLWGDISINLIALSPDGKPVSEPGEAGVAYPFRCEVVSGISELEFSWDIGDGSSPVTASNEVNITWTEDGQYLLKVEVKDKSNGNIIGTATAQVQIGSDELLDFILSCTDFQHWIGLQEAIQFTPAYEGPTPPSGYTGGNIELEWSGLNFSANNETETDKITISGSLSNDGKKVNVVVDLTRTFTDYQSKFTWSITDLPFDYFEPDGIEHAWDRPGVVYQTSQSNIKNHLSLSGYITSFGTTYNINGINWNLIDECRITIFTWNK